MGRATSRSFYAAMVFAVVVSGTITARAQSCPDEDPRCGSRRSEAEACVSHCEGTTLYAAVKVDGTCVMQPDENSQVCRDSNDNSPSKREEDLGDHRRNVDPPVSQ